MGFFVVCRFHDNHFIPEFYTTEKEVINIIGSLN